MSKNLRKISPRSKTRKPFKLCVKRPTNRKYVWATVVSIFEGENAQANGFLHSLINSSSCIPMSVNSSSNNKVPAKFCT